MDFIKSGQFISELRKEKCMTQADLGTILGVTDKTVSKWERGVNIPDILMIKEIAKVFNVTADEILNAERDKTEVSTILKFYRNKKLRYASIGIGSAFILFTLVLLVYFTNNYDKSKVYKFKGIEDNYKITGYIYGIGKEVRVVIDDLMLENTEEYEDVNIIGYTIKLFIGDSNVYSKKIDLDEETNFLNLMNELMKVSVSPQNLNLELEYKKGYFLVEFLDANLEVIDFRFDFNCNIDLRNNRFFYN